MPQHVGQRLVARVQEDRVEFLLQRLDDLLDFGVWREARVISK